MRNIANLFVFSVGILANLEQTKDKIINVPFVYGYTNWNYLEKKRPHEKFIAGFGINLITGITTFYETFWKRHLKETKEGFFTIDKTGMPVFSKWLKPHTLFRIVVGEHRRPEPYSYKSTLLYVDSDEKVIVVTRSKNKILKTLLYIWMITNNLLSPIPDDEYLQKTYYEQNKMSRFEDIRNFNKFISDAKVVRDEERTFENLDDEKIFDFKINLYSYMSNYLDRKDRLPLFKQLTKDNTIPSLKELSKWEDLFKRMYKKLKWRTKRNYIEFPLYKIVMWNDQIFDNLGPIRSKRVVFLSPSANYVINK
ncbi:hypothetical protein NGRA_0057 [Nosema granulosis]|uniref:Uncharacterized protein n=1 Tax=Nosema granulosis TaxID=83296 RepID=A0A9P6H2P0_9MICR|nr:hypothetical protein NGRA_0057 [Nosema granulosis]